MVTTQKEARMRIRMLPLAGNQSLLVAKCIQCGTGLLVGAIGSQHIGIVSAGCIDCDNTLDFYIHSGEHKAWLMQPIDMDLGRATKK